MRKTLAYIATAILLTACSGVKDIPEDVLLLHRVGVIADNEYEDIKPRALKPYVVQREQIRWFGLVRKAVVLDSTQTQKSCENLRSYMFNKGYLNAHIEVMTLPKGNRKVDLVYVLHPEQPYFLNQMDYEIHDPNIEKFLTPYLQPFGSQRFNVEKLDQERKRITQLLTNNGYYHFNKTDIAFRADSTVGNRQVNVTMVLNRYRPTSEIDTLHQQYRIRNLQFLSGNEDGPIPLRKNVLRNNTLQSVLCRRLAEHIQPFRTTGSYTIHQHQLHGTT